MCFNYSPLSQSQSERFCVFKSVIHRLSTCRVVITSAYDSWRLGSLLMPGGWFHYVSSFSSVPNRKCSNTALNYGTAFSFSHSSQFTIEMRRSVRWPDSSQQQTADWRKRRNASVVLAKLLVLQRRSLNSRGFVASSGTVTSNTWASKDLRGGGGAWSYLGKPRIVVRRISNCILREHVSAVGCDDVGTDSQNGRCFYCIALHTSCTVKAV
jgi:hypothetical protein